MSSGAKQHSYAEHITDSLNISRTTWSTMTSPRPSWHSENLPCPSTPTTVNDMQKKPTPLIVTLALPEMKERLPSPKSPTPTFPLDSALMVSSLPKGNNVVLKTTSAYSVVLLDTSLMIVQNLLPPRPTQPRLFSESGSQAISFLGISTLYTKPR